MPRRDRLVTVEYDDDIQALLGKAAATKESAATALAFDEFGATARELLSRPSSSDLSLTAAFEATRLTVSPRKAILSHTLPLAAGELVASVGAGHPWLRAPSAVSLGLKFTRPTPRQGAVGLLSLALEADTCQRTGTVSTAASVFGLRVGAATALGRGTIQSYSFGCEVGNAAAGVVAARCDGSAVAAPESLTLSLLAPPVPLAARILGTPGPLSLAAEVTASRDGQQLRMGAALPVAQGVRAKVTADASGGVGCHLLFNEPRAPCVAIGVTANRGVGGAVAAAHEVLLLPSLLRLR